MLPKVFLKRLASSENQFGRLKNIRIWSKLHHSVQKGKKDTNIRFKFDYQILNIATRQLEKSR